MATAAQDRRETSRAAVVLAAGHDETSRALLTRPLGERTVVQLAMDNVRALFEPSDIIVVVAPGDQTIRELVGDDVALVEQPEPLGTGHAVSCARDAIPAGATEILIAYGDTPLLRPESLRGLLNRHELKGADLSLLTAIVDQPLPYGRIERDRSGRVRAILEASDLDPHEREIHEINVGAYVIAPFLLFPELDAMAANQEHRLTELARRLISADGEPRVIASYRIFDTDEVQGINSDDELAAAADILLKRLFRPRKNTDTTIAFGTGGWRAVIGEGFTLGNVRRLCQAVANETTRRGMERHGVVIGGDRRFLSEQSAQAAAEVFAGNNIPVVLLPGDVPTPLVTFAAPHLGSAYGLIFTASHNPPEWNGLKVFKHDGSLPMEDETNRYQSEANSLSADDIVTLDLDLAKKNGVVVEHDLTNAYIDAIEKIIDTEVIRGSEMRVIVDPMYGTSQLTLGTILSDARVRVDFIHERHNPLFGGRSPAPDLGALSALIAQIKDSKRYDLGMATDGDADRIAIVDENGEYISTNDVLLVLYWYLHEVRGERGGVVRNLATTHLLDRLAAHFGETCREVPVGFKHVTAGMLEDDAVLGGESSGGLTIRGHILGKDGIFACALVVEMLARTGKKMSELIEMVYEITGRLYSVETGIPSTPEMRVQVPRRLEQQPMTHIGPYPVVGIDYFDGTKIRLENDNWVLLRFSGTEPILRMFAEADSPEKADELLQWLRDFVTVT